jgi:hypothetical protein
MPGRRPQIDLVREERITNEVVVDCYNEHEAYTGWFCYLEEHLRFPLEARCVDRVKGSPLALGDQVKVTGILDDGQRGPFWAVVEWKDDEVSVPLSILEVISGSEKGHEAVADWRYWVEQGRQF